RRHAALEVRVRAQAILVAAPKSAEVLAHDALDHFRGQMSGDDRIADLREPRNASDVLRTPAASDAGPEARAVVAFAGSDAPQSLWSPAAAPPRADAAHREAAHARHVADLRAEEVAGGCDVAAPGVVPGRDGARGGTLRENPDDAELGRHLEHLGARD